MARGAPVPPHHRLLFVYGTLRRDGEAHERLRSHAAFLDAATIGGELLDLGAYPALVLSEAPRRRVAGEVYRLHAPAAALAVLDAYEGIGGGEAGRADEYERVFVPVAAHTRGRLLAWTYVYARPPFGIARVAGGDWLRHLRERSRRRGKPSQ